MPDETVGNSNIDDKKLCFVQNQSTNENACVNI